MCVPHDDNGVQIVLDHHVSFVSVNITSARDCNPVSCVPY
jgi:hypothetical protein